MQQYNEALELEKLVNEYKSYQLYSIITGLIQMGFVGVLFTGFIDKFAPSFQIAFLFANFIFFIFLVFTLWKFNKKWKDLNFNPLFKAAQKTNSMKIVNEQVSPFSNVLIVGNFAIITLIFAKINKVQLPILIYLALFTAILFITFWMFDLIQRATNQVRDDELRFLKAKDSGYFGYYLGVILLVALLLTILWMPELKAQITKNFAGFEIEIAIAFSIFALLIGGLLGRFVTWDKYR